MNSLESNARTLIAALDLPAAPVALCFVDSVPEGVPTYQGSVPAGCRFRQAAATRVFATVPADHELCAIGVYTHNLEGVASCQESLQDSLKVFGDLGYVRQEDPPFIPVLNRAAKVVVYGPLGATPMGPGCRAVVREAKPNVDPFRSLAAGGKWMAARNGPTACAVVPQAINTGRTALSLGCCGARAYLDALTAGCRPLRHPRAGRSRPSPSASRLWRKPMPCSRPSTLCDGRMWRRAGVPASNKP